MTVKIIKFEDGINRKISDSHSVLNLLTADDSDNVSLAISSADKHNEMTKTVSDRVYYILDGELIVDDNLVAKKGSVVFVSANTEYNLKGSFRAIVVNSPPFRKIDEKIAE